MNASLSDSVPAEAEFVFHLFVTGAAPNSTRAIHNLTHLCEQHLRGRYELRVVDMYQEPHHAKEHQIIAVPTLIRRSPLPERRLIGDLSDRARVLALLGVK